MKILVLSDSHGDLERARNILQYIGSKIDMVFHLGDYASDAMDLEKEFPSIVFHYVQGNCDYEAGVPDHKIVRTGGKAFLLTHGHKQGVHWNLDHIAYWAEEQGADAVLFGHTHRAFCDDHGRVMLFNPGSISLPRDTEIPTFGILTIENGILQGSVMEYWNERTFRPRMRY